jgi:hypothetical protein
MPTLTNEQLELCEVCEYQKYTVKHGLICSLTEKPAEFETVCDKFKENEELKTFRDHFRHLAYINEKSTGIEVRLANYFLDYLLIGLTTVLLISIIGLQQKPIQVNGSEAIVVKIFYYLIIKFLYFLIFESITGRTPAKFITRTIVITTTCKKPTFYHIFIRTICRFIPLEPLSFLGDEPTGWHDELSKTVVIFK